MGRDHLRRTLAYASMEILKDHTISIPNIRRYVVPLLHNYRICKDEPISNKDIHIAHDLILTKLSEAQKPIEFRFGRDDVSREMRRIAFLENDLVVK